MATSYQVWSSDAGVRQCGFTGRYTENAADDTLKSRYTSCSKVSSGTGGGSVGFSKPDTSRLSDETTAFDIANPCKSTTFS